MPSAHPPSAHQVPTLLLISHPKHTAERPLPLLRHLLLDLFALRLLLRFTISFVSLPIFHFSARSRYFPLRRYIRLQTLDGLLPLSLMLLLLSPCCKPSNVELGEVGHATRSSTAYLPSRPTQNARSSSSSAHLLQFQTLRHLFRHRHRCKVCWWTRLPCRWGREGGGGRGGSGCRGWFARVCVRES